VSPEKKKQKSAICTALETLLKGLMKFLKKCTSAEYAEQVHRATEEENKWFEGCKAEHECGSPAAHYRYTRGKTRGYETRRSEFLVITGLHGSGFSLWCCEYLPQVLMTK